MISSSTALRHSLIPATGIALGYALFCWLTLSHQYTFDAISYLKDVEVTRLTIPLQPQIIAYNFFHSQHLLFSLSVYIVYHLLMFIGYHGTALLPAQVLNIAEGSVVLAILFSILQALTSDSLLAVIASALLGATYSFWSNTAMISDHMTSCLMALVLFWAVWKTNFSTASLWRIAFLGFLNGVAALMHQANVILGVLLLVALWSEKHSARRHISILSVYIISAALILGIPYVLVGVFVLGNTTIYDFVFWCFYYAMPGVMSVSGHYGTFSLDKILIFISGIGASVVGGFYWMNRIFETEPFRLLSVPMLSAVALASSCIALFLLRRGRLQDRPLSPRIRLAMQLLAAWFGIYALLLFWWWPTYYQLWAVPLVAGVLLAGLFIHACLDNPLRHRPVFVVLFSMIVLAILTANSIAAFVPAHDTANNDYYTATLSLKSVTSPDDLIVIPGNDEYEVYIPYFIGRKTVSLHSVFIDHLNDRAASFAELKKKMNEAWNERSDVFLFAELRDSDDIYEDVFAMHNLTCADRRQFFDQFSVTDTLSVENVTLYKLERPSKREERN
ncbi:MAG: hypothetical protein HYR77_07625 [Ignavibacteria bacterium]|nr:hypothetical protein [Ignavibacteria bacterium]